MRAGSSITSVWGGYGGHLPGMGERLKVHERLETHEWLERHELGKMYAYSKLSMGWRLSKKGIFDSLQGGRYRNLPYIWGTARKFYVLLGYLTYANNFPNYLILSLSTKI